MKTKKIILIAVGSCRSSRRRNLVLYRFSGKAQGDLCQRYCQ